MKLSGGKWKEYQKEEARDRLDTELISDPRKSAGLGPYIYSSIQTKILFSPQETTILRWCSGGVPVVFQQRLRAWVVNPIPVQPRSRICPSPSEHQLSGLHLTRCPLLWYCPQYLTWASLTLVTGPVRSCGVYVLFVEIQLLCGIRITIQEYFRAQF